MANWFARTIEGSDLPDFGPLLAQAGVLIQPVRPTAAWAGAVRLPATGAPVIAAALAPGTPLYAVGVSLGGSALLNWIGRAGHEGGHLDRLGPQAADQGGHVAPHRLQAEDGTGI